jgi:long-chain fatty acid transport protein
MSRTSGRMWYLVTGLFYWAFTSTAQASGFAVIELSGSGQGNAFAGAAAVAEDASTVYFNPAGMTRLSGRQIVASVHAIKVKADFTNEGSTQAGLLGGGPLSGGDDNSGGLLGVPNLYLVQPLNNGLVFGFGINAPFGLSTKYDEDWVGRYHGVKSDMKTINFNPSLAWKANDALSLGAGINIQYVDVKLSSAIDFGAFCYGALGPATCGSLGVAPQMTDGFAELTGDNTNDLSWGYNLGLLYQLNSATRIGLAYRSEIDHHVEGDANFSVPAAAGSFTTGIGLFTDTGLQADVTVPQSVSLSLYHDMNDQLALLADVTWTGWSVFDELRIRYDNPNQPDSVTTENWQDTLRYSVGANYRMNSEWLLRGGLAYDETPIPDAAHRTPRIPGNSRTWLSMGASWFYAKELTFDFGYTHIFVPNPKTNNTFESSVPTLAATLNGSYDAAVDILSAQLRWNY